MDPNLISGSESEWAGLHLKGGGALTRMNQLLSGGWIDQQNTFYRTELQTDGFDHKRKRTSSSVT